MKKVLIISNIWPYSPGNLRIPGLAKYLPEFEWEPVVLTQPLLGKPDLGYRVIEVPYHDMLSSLLRLLGFDTSKSVRKQVGRKLGITSKRSILDHIFLVLRDITSYPDSIKGWKSPAIKVGSKLIENENIRAIISSSPPIISNLVAKELKVRHRIPWVADFPHLWSQDHAHPCSRIKNMFDKRLELRTLCWADALTTTNKAHAVKFKMLHKEKPIYAISHGFDPETINVDQDISTDKFTMTYTGTFGVGAREPTRLFLALQRLISKGIMDPTKVEVRFYGPVEEWIESEINKYGLRGIVKQCGMVPMTVAQQKQRESQLLLVIKFEPNCGIGMLSSKSIEYLAARRPILAIGEHKEADDDMIKYTGAGKTAASHEEIEHVLKELYEEFIQTGKVSFYGDISRMERYSQREMARRFAKLLEHYS